MSCHCTRGNAHEAVAHNHHIYLHHDHNFLGSVGARILASI